MLHALLFDSYTVAEVPPDEWQAVVDQHQAAVFPHETAASLEGLLTAPEQAQRAALRQNLAGVRQLHLLVLAEGEPVGWHYGFQRSELEYFMANTGLLPAHQGRGLYSALLPVLVAWARAAGFQYLTR